MRAHLPKDESGRMGRRGMGVGVGRLGEAALRVPSAAHRRAAAHACACLLVNA